MSTVFPQQLFSAQSVQIQNLFETFQAAFDGIKNCRR